MHDVQGAEVIHSLDEALIVLFLYMLIIAGSLDSALSMIRDPCSDPAPTLRKCKMSGVRDPYSDPDPTLRKCRMRRLGACSDPRSYIKKCKMSGLCTPSLIPAPRLRK